MGEMSQASERVSAAASLPAGAEIRLEESHFPAPESSCESVLEASATPAEAVRPSPAVILAMDPKVEAGIAEAEKSAWSAVHAFSSKCRIARVGTGVLALGYLAGSAPHLLLPLAGVVAGSIALRKWLEGIIPGKALVDRNVLVDRTVSRDTHKRLEESAARISGKAGIDAPAVYYNAGDSLLYNNKGNWLIMGTQLLGDLSDRDMDSLLASKLNPQYRAEYEQTDFKANVMVAARFTALFGVSSLIAAAFHASGFWAGAACVAGAIFIMRKAAWLFSKIFNPSEEQADSAAMLSGTLLTRDPASSISVIQRQSDLTVVKAKQSFLQKQEERLNAILGQKAADVES